MFILTDYLSTVVSITERIIEKSPSAIVDLSVLPSVPLVFALCFEAPLLCNIHIINIQISIAFAESILFHSLPLTHLCFYI